jgi:Leucine-rich repeat (LRR) protein
MQSLPESLAALAKLRKLDARNNPITHIPPALRQKPGLELLVDEPKG